MQKGQVELSKLILDYIGLNPHCSSREIHEGIVAEISYATVKRAIQILLNEQAIVKFDNGKATKYEISRSFSLLSSIDTELYFKQEIDKRKIINSFNQSLITNDLANISLFREEELLRLSGLQNEFKKNLSTLSKESYKKEFERLAIDLSWKSSQIEGNTYSLLETERLLKEQKHADGKTRDEATMLLNHKAALDFILEEPSYIQPLSVSAIEDIHSILIKELMVDMNIRSRRIGISGTNYQPLDNEFQIKEAMTDMCELINEHSNVFEKALLVLLLVSYIQPFADGNKRTARIISNAFLINENYCPISFRTVDSIDYKKAMLVFYEQNNISAFKKIFIDQFEFAVKTYF